MNTTYILHGGATRKELVDNDYFFQQFTSHIDKQLVRILLCYFARKRNEWSKLLERDGPKIRKFSNKKIDLILVNDAGDLFEKLKETDVLYVAGGEAEHLEPYYPKLKGLESALKGKVYLGSSMGAFMVSKNYVLPFWDKNKVHKGLGILPVSTLCHWDIETEKENMIKLLKKEDNQSPILLLDEGKSSVFVK